MVDASEILARDQVIDKDETAVRQAIGTQQLVSSILIGIGTIVEIGSRLRAG